MKTIIVDLFYPVEWFDLVKSTLTKETPIAPSDVPDDDRTPYRQDCRLTFTPIPSTRNRTHMAKLSLESDDNRYHIFLSIDELACDNQEKVEVFRQEIPDLHDHAIRVNTINFKATNTTILPRTIAVNIACQKSYDGLI